MDYAALQQPEQIFRISTKQEATYAFRLILQEESLLVTSVLFVSEKSKGNPLSINPYLNKLISLRLSDKIYHGKAINSRHLGIRLFESLIPDEALTHITIEDLLIFRERTKNYCEAWEIEVNKLEAQLVQQGTDLTDIQIQCIIDQEITPRLFELKQEIKKIRNDQFSNILKLIKNTGISLIAGGTLSSISIPLAIAAFVGVNLKLPKYTDEFIDSRFKLNELKTGNGLTYLMKINQLTRN